MKISNWLHRTINYTKFGFKIHTREENRMKQKKLQQQLKLTMKEKT